MAEIPDSGQSAVPTPQPGKRGCGGCAFIGCATILFITFFITILAGNFLVVSDRIKQVDAIVVLSGSEDDRIPEAARLHKAGISDTVILTDTGLSKTPTPGTEEIPINPTRIKAEELAGMGVPISNILLPEGVVGSTAEEAQAVLDMMQRQGLASAVVVTDPYHTRRTSLIFDQVFDESGIKLLIHPVEDHWFQPMTWWLHPEGWQFAALEYLKLASLLIGN